MGYPISIIILFSFCQGSYFKCLMAMMAVRLCEVWLVLS